MKSDPYYVGYIIHKKKYNANYEKKITQGPKGTLVLVSIPDFSTQLGYKLIIQRKQSTLSILYPCFNPDPWFL